MGVVLALTATHSHNDRHRSDTCRHAQSHSSHAVKITTLESVHAWSQLKILYLRNVRHAIVRHVLEWPRDYPPRRQLSELIHS